MPAKRKQDADSGPGRNMRIKVDSAGLPSRGRIVVAEESSDFGGSIPVRDGTPCTDDSVVVVEIVGDNSSTSEVKVEDDAETVVHGIDTKANTSAASDDVKVEDTGTAATVHKEDVDDCKPTKGELSVVKHEKDGKDKEKDGSSPGHKETDSQSTADHIDTTLMTVGLDRRIRTMREECNTSSGVYYITKVPMDLPFGLYQGFDMRNLLVQNVKRNFPIKLYVAGRATAMGFFNSDGVPLGRQFISIRTLCEADSAAAAEIINNYSVPFTHFTHHGYATILAGRWQQPFGSSAGTPANRFSNVYLATTGMRDRTRYDVEKLKKNDLVVLELRVRKRADPDDPQHHTAGFQLMAINVLQVATSDDDQAEVSQAEVNTDTVDW